MKQLTVLGSTGSIGCSTLDVVRHNPGRFSVAALVAGKNVDRMVEQCLEFTPRYAVMDDAQSAERLRTRLHEHGCRTEVLSGQQAAAQVAHIVLPQKRPQPDPEAQLLQHDGADDGASPQLHGESLCKDLLPGLGHPVKALEDQVQIHLCKGLEIVHTLSPTIIITV